MYVQTLRINLENDVAANVVVVVVVVVVVAAVVLLKLHKLLKLLF